MMSMGRGKFSLVPDEHIDLRRAAKTGIPEDGPALFVHKTHDLAAARIPREATDAILCTGGDPESRVVAREHHYLAARVKAGKMLLLVGRSEEHTYELQSLMRISSAVIGLTNKKKPK